MSFLVIWSSSFPSAQKLTPTSLSVLPPSHVHTLQATPTTRLKVTLRSSCHNFCKLSGHSSGQLPCPSSSFNSIASISLHFFHSLPAHTLFVFLVVPTHLPSHQPGITNRFFAAPSIHSTHYGLIHFQPDSVHPLPLLCSLRCHPAAHRDGSGFHPTSGRSFHSL
jgi:hypothetical protein